MRNHDSLRRRLARLLNLLAIVCSPCFRPQAGRWLAALGSLAVMLSTGAAASTVSVTLAWDPSPDPSVVGYKVYYGTASENYSSSVLITNGTSVQITGLVVGTTYYFSATTLNNAGLESGFSGELTYRAVAPASAPPELSISPLQDKVQINIIGPPDYGYDVEASADLWHWILVGTVGLDTYGAGSVTFDRASTGGWFYRLRQTAP